MKGPLVRLHWTLNINGLVEEKPLSHTALNASSNDIAKSSGCPHTPPERHETDLFVCVALAKLSGDGGTVSRKVVKGGNHLLVAHCYLKSTQKLMFQRVEPKRIGFHVFP
jgi:hypothetical protein